jgi:hypothetical protein
VKSFAESTYFLGLRDASFFATDLFLEAFRQPFPVPRDSGGLPIRTATGDWRQYVAFYKWSETWIEPVAFANFIRHDDVWLEGGLCARRHFYRRLPAAHWRECKARGGIVRMLLEAAAGELNEAAAWFGYCGDAKSRLLAERIGYVQTRHPRLMVKWFRELPEEARRALEAKIAAIGAF